MKYDNQNDIDLIIRKKNDEIMKEIKVTVPDSYTVEQVKNSIFNYHGLKIPHQIIYKGSNTLKNTDNIRNYLDRNNIRRIYLELEYNYDSDEEYLKKNGNQSHEELSEINNNSNNNFNSNVSHSGNHFDCNSLNQNKKFNQNKDNNIHKKRNRDDDNSNNQNHINKNPYRNQQNKNNNSFNDKNVSQSQNIDNKNLYSHLEEFKNVMRFEREVFKMPEVVFKSMTKTKPIINNKVIQDKGNNKLREALKAFKEGKFKTDSHIKVVSEAEPIENKASLVKTDFDINIYDNMEDFVSHICEKTKEIKIESEEVQSLQNNYILSNNNNNIYQIGNSNQLEQINTIKKINFEYNNFKIAKENILDLNDDQMMNIPFDEENEMKDINLIKNNIENYEDAYSKNNNILNNISNSEFKNNPILTPTFVITDPITEKSNNFNHEPIFTREDLNNEFKYLYEKASKRKDGLEISKRLQNFNKILDSIQLDNSFLMMNEKLNVILDIDSTLLFTEIKKNEFVLTTEEYESTDVKLSQFKIGNILYYLKIKFRKGLKDFLTKVSNFSTIYINTLGFLQYGIQIAKELEAEYGIQIPYERIRGRASETNERSQLKKTISQFQNLKKDKTIILDDTCEVWGNDSPYIVPSMKVIFFCERNFKHDSLEIFKKIMNNYKLTRGFPAAERVIKDSEIFNNFLPTINDPQLYVDFNFVPLIFEYDHSTKCQLKYLEKFYERVYKITSIAKCETKHVISLYKSTILCGIKLNDDFQEYINDEKKSFIKGIIETMGGIITSKKYATHFLVSRGRKHFFDKENKTEWQIKYVLNIKFLFHSYFFLTKMNEDDEEYIQLFYN